MVGYHALKYLHAAQFRDAATLKPRHKCTVSGDDETPLSIHPSILHPYLSIHLPLHLPTLPDLLRRL